MKTKKEMKLANLNNDMKNYCTFIKGGIRVRKAATYFACTKIAEHSGMVVGNLSGEMHTQHLFFPMK